MTLFGLFIVLFKSVSFQISLFKKKQRNKSEKVLNLARLNLAINRIPHRNLPSTERTTPHLIGIFLSFRFQSLDPSWQTAWPLSMASSTALPRNLHWSFSAPVVRAWFPTSCASFSLPTLPAPSASSHCPSLPNETLITGPTSILSFHFAFSPFLSRICLKISICRCNTSLLIDYGAAAANGGDRKYILIDVGKTFRETVLRWFVAHRIPRIDSVSSPFSTCLPS